MGELLAMAGRPPDPGAHLDVESGLAKRSSAEASLDRLPIASTAEGRLKRVDAVRTILWHNHFSCGPGAVARRTRRPLQAERRERPHTDRHPSQSASEGQPVRQPSSPPEPEGRLDSSQGKGFGRSDVHYGPFRALNDYQAEASASSWPIQLVVR